MSHSTWNDRYALDMSKRRLSRALVLLAFLSSAHVCFGARQAQGELLGPPQDCGTLVDMTAKEGARWTCRGGGNVEWHAIPGYAIPGVATSLLKLSILHKDQANHLPDQNWFATDRKGLAPGLVAAAADGIHFSVLSMKEAQWWVSFDLRLADGNAYSKVVADAPFPAGQVVDLLVPFEEFKSSSGQQLNRARAGTLRDISMVLGGGGQAPNSFCLSQITVYTRPRYSYWLSFATSHGENNLFYRDEPVVLRFDRGGRWPEAARGFRYVIGEGNGRIVARGTAPLKETGTVQIRPALPPFGYFEVRAFATGLDGKDLLGASCIRAEGSVPAGLGTFCVLPATQAENVALHRRYGEKAFFGLHGDFLGLAEHIGLTWRFEYSAWRYLEPSRPDRSAGPAPWAAERLAQPSEPDYRPHFQPFVFNIRSSLPTWAAGSSDQAPAFKSWDDAMAVVRDQVLVEKHAHPTMKPRIYGGDWEVNLNSLPYLSQPPEFKPTDVAELYRRVREVVKANDPGGIVVGPCSSTLDLPWFEGTFKAGVLKYVDGIETHAYTKGAFTPEADDLAAGIEGLNCLVRKYNRGKSLAIYCTERGDRGLVGGKQAYREQAQLAVRAAIILKGEGVRVYLPFYGIDYDAGQYGFAFNLDIDGPNGPWATKRISPKPTVLAMAICVQQLEGASPVARIRNLGSDVWAYKFIRGRTAVTAVWTTGVSRVDRIPVGGKSAVTVIDMLGSRASAVSRAGIVSLSISQSPRYLVVAR